MVDISNKQDCCGCYSCKNKCPVNAIKMEEDEKGFRYPIIDKNICIDCGICEKVCPILKKCKTENAPKAYAAYNKDEEVRLNSSSGGVFTLIAEHIINQGGVVFGAAFDTDFSVRHMYAVTVEELEKFRTSKYLQSRIEDTYKQAEDFLKQNRKVLFTGTPCQVEGLLSFLNKNYNNLITQDIICHGVPSPKVWKKYLDYRKSRDNEEPVKINFRQKENGWNSYAMEFKYPKSFYKNNRSSDLYMRAFLKDFSLRDSCYNCSFKKKNRPSDLTLADFWGINNIAPEINDNKGTSLVIVNSVKGEKLFDSISNDIVFKQVEFEDSIKYNPSMTKSVSKHKNREKFFDNLDKMNFDELVGKFIPKDNIIKKVINKSKMVVKKALRKIVK